MNLILLTTLTFNKKNGADFILSTPLATCYKSGLN